MNVDTAPTAPRLRPLMACSAHAEGCGYELSLASPDPGQSALAQLTQAIEWIGDRWPSDGRFVMLPMPAGLTLATARALVDVVCTQGLDGKLCLIGAMPDLPDRRSMDLLASSGVMLVLDGVGRATRFGDMIAMPLNGIRFEADLVEQSIGDPALGSLVDGALHMARNLGLTTFAPLGSAESRAAWGDDFIDYASVATAPGGDADTRAAASLV